MAVKWSNVFCLTVFHLSKECINLNTPCTSPVLTNLSNKNNNNTVKYSSSNNDNDDTNVIIMNNKLHAAAVFKFLLKKLKKCSYKLLRYVFCVQTVSMSPAIVMQ